MKSEEKRWEIIQFKPLIMETIPYNKCPRCGEFKFRVVIRKRPKGLFSLKIIKSNSDECENCKYTIDRGYIECSLI